MSSPSSPKTVKLEVGLPARDRLKLELTVLDDHIETATLSGIGCSELLRLLKDYRQHLAGNVSALPIPSGDHHAAILLRELVLKARGEWKFPYLEEEVCHCRAVSTKIVDGAIVAGCHTPQAVSKATGASTSCGTCRPDVEAMIEYRLQR